MDPFRLEERKNSNVMGREIRERMFNTATVEQLECGCHCGKFQCVSAFWKKSEGIMHGGK